MLLAITRVQTWSGPRALSSASGFFFRRDARLFLITSRHVFFDQPSGHAPDGVQILCHTDTTDLARVQSLRLPHAIQTFGTENLPTGLHASGICDVGDSLAIPSFPLGFHDTVHVLPVVRTAGVASAYGVRFQRRGCFLTDGRTHRGSSGAPVLRHAGAAGGPRPWWLLGIHSSRMDMSDRDTRLDESLGLNCAWYADVLTTLTDAPSGSTP